jgi:hypothetical protein
MDVSEATLSANDLPIRGYVRIPQTLSFPSLTRVTELLKAHIVDNRFY